MADIVQLEEKGTVLYPKTHVQAIDGLEETVVSKKEMKRLRELKILKRISKLTESYYWICFTQ